MAKLVVGENDLETWCKNNGYEELLNEWHPTLNDGLVPQMFSYGSEKKIWWICKNKHEWQTNINVRIRGNGCPYCSGRYPIAGETDLQTVSPNLAKEWNYDKNGLLKPTEVTYKSDKKVWWKCALGHEWEARIANRQRAGIGCPYCAGSKTLKGFNDLETRCKANKREELLVEWNYNKNHIMPDEISPANNKKVWWICSLGHEWDSTIGSRTIGRPSGCPYCSNPPKRILIGFNDLESWCKTNQRENLLTEWDYEKNDISPTEVTFGSGKYVWWKCSKNHEWKTQVHNRTEGSKTNCPICARTQTSFPEQAVAFYLRKEYEILQRYRIKGREVDVFIPKYNIAIEYDGSMWHSGKDKVKQDLEKTKKLVSEGITLIRLRETKDNMSVNIVDGQYVIEFVAGNGKYVTTEFEWALNELYKVINSITNHKDVPIIDMNEDELQIRAYYMNVLKENSVASVFPELIEEWDVEKNEGITPDVFSARNNKRVWWKCSKGHSWLASINTRGEHKLGCPYCAGQRVVAGENDLESWCKNNDSTLMSEWNYEKNIINPSDITKSYNKNIWWKCTVGHEWEATVNNRVHGTGCPICNVGNKVKRNSVSLAEWCDDNNSSLCDEWNYERNMDITPQSVTYGSHAKVWWKCSKGHEWEAVVKSRTRNHGCPYCSSTYKKAIKGINDLETWCKQNDREYILEEWDALQNGELTPDMVTWGSHKRIHWKCKKGHTWEAVVKERTKIRGNRCSICRKEL